MIRPAHLLDLPRILELGQEYSHEAREQGLHDPDWNSRVAASNFIASVGQGHLGNVAVMGGKVVGFMWAIAAPATLWTDVITAQCLIFYVTPDYRGTSCGIQLLRKFDKWSQEMQCSDSYISTASGINTNRVNKLFVRMGYSPLGTVYRKVLKEES